MSSASGNTSPPHPHATSSPHLSTNSPPPTHSPLVIDLTSAGPQPQTSRLTLTSHTVEFPENYSRTRSGSAFKLEEFQLRPAPNPHLNQPPYPPPPPPASTSLSILLIFLPTFFSSSSLHHYHPTTRYIQTVQEVFVLCETFLDVWCAMNFALTS